MPLYEIAVLSVPSKKEIEDGTTEKLIYFSNPPVVAANESAAIFALVQNQPDLKGVDFNKVQVVVRPFV